MTIDLDKITELGLTLDQFLALFKVYAPANNLTIDYSSDVPDTYFEIEKKRLIKLIIKDEVVMYILREHGREVVEKIIDVSSIPKPDTSTEKNVPSKKSRVDKFDEFWKTFPLSDSHGYYTKTRTLKSNKQGCRSKYSKLLLEGVNHEDIIKALEHEVKDRKGSSSKTNSLTYMKNSYAWLNQREFEVILESMEENDVADDWTTNVI